ncbi:CBM_collapsed_G0000900.mRNA.1.CDS.1 [Saccharomyces cerevisiae]|nr:CBM_collapsed_G0000900.mRNA.1.CDS.1 [Saccharomyces cerevisiae]
MDLLFTSTSTDHTVTGTNGQPTDEKPYVVIRTPTSEGLVTTTTEPWTGTFTSTTVSGTNGQPTDETVIVIELQLGEGLVTTTSEPWTGHFHLYVY